MSFEPECNLSNLRFVVWDFETTGQNASRDHAVELAAIAFDENFEHRQFQALIKPPVPIPPFVSKIHGIDDEMVKDAKPAAEVFTAFAEFLSHCGSPRIMIAHNAAFDMGFLQEETKRGFSTSPFQAEVVIDSCMLAKSLLPDLKNHKLGDLVRHFGLGEFDFHRALQDVKALKEVFLRLIGILADRTHAEEIKLSHLIHAAQGYFSFPTATEKAGFRFPPHIAALEELCGSQDKIGIVYDVEEEYRYITPVSVEVKQFKVYVKAFCHRDQIQKTFRADRIMRLGKKGDF